MPMPIARRAQRQPTDDWRQLRLLATSSEQEPYELLRPTVLFGRSSADRARETGVPARTVRRKAARFADAGMRSLFAPDDPPAPDRRMLPLGIRKAIVELKAECPALRPYEIATICRHRFGRAVGHHTVERVLAGEPLPLHPPRRFPRYRDIADPVARRRTVVELYEEGWTVKRIAEYLATSRSRVYDALQRWVAEDLAGLADRSRAPHQPARKVDLKAMVAIRRLQANPELGEFRIHAALE
jgi:putative transposase